MHSPSGFGFGLGNVILWVNVILLWTYTISCHSCRHVMGGRLKTFSKPGRYWMAGKISQLNVHHRSSHGSPWALWCSAPTSTSCWWPAAISDLRFIG